MKHESHGTFLLTFAHRAISMLELASVRDAGMFDFDIESTSENAAAIRSDFATVKRLAKRLGGTFKAVCVCGNSIDDLLQELPLPEEPKFNWTVSGYECDPELLLEVRLTVQEFLKSKSLGKSRFLEPSLHAESQAIKGESENVQNIQLSEIKLRDLFESVLFPKGKIPQGFDIVVHGGLGGKPIYGYSFATSDVLGFESRDFARSYQDPTMTISPRLARILVNLAMKGKTGTLLDPFCGLGTVLQEGMTCGYDVVGIDLSQSNVQRTKTNLAWLRKNQQISPKLHAKVMHADSTNLSKERVPKIDGIATEPILLPKFATNPRSKDAVDIIHRVRQVYEKSLRVFSEILEKNSRLAVMTPELVDDAGQSHALEIGQALKEAGFKPYSPQVPRYNPIYPLGVATTKKKIVQRNLYVASFN